MKRQVCIQVRDKRRKSNNRGARIRYSLVLLVALIITGCVSHVPAAEGLVINLSALKPLAVRNSEGVVPL